MTLEDCYARMKGDYGAALLVLGTEERVRRYLLRFADDPTAQMLFAALEAARWQDAFRAAHTLKGLCRGLGLTTLCEACSALTDALRAGGPPADGRLAGQAKAAYASALRAIAALEEA